MSEANNHTTFLAEKVAHYEKSGWEAYYDRNWVRAFLLLVKLNREAFHMSLPTALSAALDTVRATIAFAPLEGNDIRGATQYLVRFFEKARRSMDIEADADQLAELEMDYWIVHRRLAIQRLQAPDVDNIEPMIASLTRLHVALFKGSPEAMRRSAEWRARAAETVDRITGNYSDDVASDWERVESYLCNAYRTIQRDAEKQEDVFVRE